MGARFRNLQRQGSFLARPSRFNRGAIWQCVLENKRKADNHAGKPIDQGRVVDSPPKFNSRSLHELFTGKNQQKNEGKSQPPTAYLETSLPLLDSAEGRCLPFSLFANPNDQLYRSLFLNHFVMWNRKIGAYTVPSPPDKGRGTISRRDEKPLYKSTDSQHMEMINGPKKVQLGSFRPIRHS